MITYSFHKSPSVNKQGKSKLYLRVTISRKHRYYELLFIESCNWDPSIKRMKQIDEASVKINSFLNKKSGEVDNIIVEMNKSGIIESFDNFNTYYSKKLHSLFSYFNDVINKISKSDFDLGTIRIYKNCIDKLKDFRNGIDIDISEVDYKFIEDFEMHLSQIGLQVNTRANYLKKLNRVLNDAKKEGVLDRNPFDNFKIKQEKTRRTFLTKNELKSFVELKDSGKLNDSYIDTLKAFVFSCYTGLRHSDVKSIKYSNIRDNVIDIELKKKTSNGYKRLIVPLSSPARQMIDTTIKDNLLIFPHLKTATKCSPQLKAMAIIAGIDKDISFHVSRHTFATLSLGLGIDLKKVSELLGHDSIRTTEIYVHLVEEHLKAAVDKWDDF